MTELSEFVVGGRYEVKCHAMLRTGEGLETEIVEQLAPGTSFTILELGSNDRRRAKVVIEIKSGHVTVPCSGWLTMVTAGNEALIEKKSDLEHGSQSPGKLASSMIKSLLEAARDGNLDFFFGNNSDARQYLSTTFFN